LLHVAGVVRAPLVAVIQESPPTTALTVADLEAAGCVLALHAGLARYAVVRALQQSFGALRRDGHTAAVRDQLASFDDYNAVLGLDAWLALERQWLGDAPPARPA
jgi:2-methylisocitrate lyase-like PEP mutase family enzyme